MATKNEPFGYKPPKRTYRKLDEATVLSRIRSAKAYADGISELGDQVKQSQQNGQDTIDHMVDLFTSRHNLGFPEGRRWVGFDAKSGKTPDIVFRMQGMLAGKLKFQYVSPAGVEREARADEIEQYLNGYPSYLFRKHKNNRWDLKSLFWQLLAGRSYLQQTYLPFHWDKNEQKRKQGEEDGDYNRRVAAYRGFMGPPMRVDSIDPRMVFPLQTGAGTIGYVKKYRVQKFNLVESMHSIGVHPSFDADGNVTDVRELAGLELPDSSTDAYTGSVDYWEMIDEAMCYYVVGNKVIHAYQHDGGIGIFEALGLQTGFNEFNLQAMGVLWPVRNEIPQLDFLRTLWVNKAYIDVFPQLLAQLADTDNPLEDEDGNPREWNIEPGTVKQIRGQLINALKDAASGVDFRAMIEDYKTEIDLATIPNLLRGYAGAQQPGYSINQLVQTTRTQWKPMVTSREDQMAAIAEHHLFVVKNIINKPVTYFSSIEENPAGRRHGKHLTLDPENIEPYGEVIAHLEPDLPIDRQGNMQIYSNLAERGWMPFEEYWREGYGGTEPEQAKQRIMRDMARRAFLPAALEDAQALGRTKLTVDIIKSRGLDNLNTIGNMDVQALKEARAKGKAEGSGQPPPAAGGEMPPGIPGAQGAQPQGVAPVEGMNPANPMPGPRG